VILSGTNSSLHACGGEAAYAQYVRYLESTSSVIQAAKKEGTVENFAQGYQDYLQAPLQVSLIRLDLPLAEWAGVT
jgi:protein arginine N-methyltransferase 5